MCVVLLCFVSWDLLIQGFQGFPFSFCFSCPTGFGKAKGSFRVAERGNRFVLVLLVEFGRTGTIDSKVERAGGSDNHLGIEGGTEARLDCVLALRQPCLKFN